ncbi:MAG: HAMP domain-containing histidine kinase [Clostridiaceae bacterium]|jgi:signal transduction histidine kinase|nr:HAMP domain-containing histidine kinase [Clostridiaceae bacterium]
MDKILLISDNQESSGKFSKIFAKNTFDFFVLKDELMIMDSITVYPPDVIIIDTFSIDIDFKTIIKKIKSANENIVITLFTNESINTHDLVKYSNAFITEEMSDKLILSTINMNLKTKNSLEKLSNTNKDLADSLYRLNALYDTSSKLAGTLDKKKLLDYMVEGMDKSLSFSLTCLLSFCEGENPVLILNSLYELSDELIEAIKLRTILNYKSLFENSKVPHNFSEEDLKIVKIIKYPATRFNFSLFQFDNMFAPISLGDDFFGCVEIFKDDTFQAEDATCFQTIVRQVTLPLKGATLYQELIETNKELEKLERLKSDFISIVSHELRTPLTSIKNALDILSGGKCCDINATAEKFFSMAKRNVKSLSRIINDLLDLSKIEAGKMEFNFKECNIQTVIDYVKSSLSELAKGKCINLQVESRDLPLINADSQRLEQVLTNLVSNAIKFTPENKNIYIRTDLINAKDIKANPLFKDEIKKLNGDCVVVTVEDEGIGIAQKDLKKAFDKFAQIENSLSRKVGGTGLGLPIAKQLLDAHQGAIWCDSVPEKGSKFYFAIPVMKVGVPL